MAMNQSYKNLKYPYQIKDAIKSNDLSIFWFPFSVKCIKDMENILSSPPPETKTRSFWWRIWELKDDGSSGLYDILLLEFMIHGLRTDKKNMFSPSGAKISHPKGFKGKKPARLGYAEVFCNWTPSELELILNRCLFHPL